MTEVPHAGGDDIEELRTRFEAVDCSDKRAVLLWFRQIFLQCAKAKRRVPGHLEVIERIKRESGLMPDEDVPGLPPKGSIESWMGWMIVVCLGTLLRLHDDFYLYYKTDADIIGMQLLDHNR
jgi:hypothetical protein